MRLLHRLRKHGKVAHLIELALERAAFLGPCASNEFIALVEAFPNLKGIIIPAGIGLPAAARALEQAGSPSKIKLTGLAPATFMKKYIVDGSAQDIWWNVKDLGYLTYYAAQALAQCKVTGKKAEGRAHMYRHAGRLLDRIRRSGC